MFHPNWDDYSGEGFFVVWFRFKDQPETYLLRSKNWSSQRLWILSQSTSQWRDVVPSWVFLFYRYASSSAAVPEVVIQDWEGMEGVEGVEGRRCCLQEFPYSAHPCSGVGGTGASDPINGWTAVRWCWMMLDGKLSCFHSMFAEVRKSTHSVGRHDERLALTASQRLMYSRFSRCYYNLL